LQLGFADTNEYIDSTVECYSMQCERVNGTIGQTVCLFREVSENWAKTTLYNARATLSGSPKRSIRRSNIITVASSTFFGPYDYRCDGTDDDVQIQEAIDELGKIGGGEIHLTDGTYSVGSVIALKDNIKLVGWGASTVITFGSTSLSEAISLNGNSNVVLRDFLIDGESTNRTGTYAIRAASCTNCTIDTIEIKNMVRTTGATLTPIYVLGAIIRNCYIHDITSSVAGIYVIGITGAVRVEYCVIENITATGGGGALGHGLWACYKCQQNKTSGCTTSGYLQSYASSDTSAACADTAAGGFNS